MEVGVYAPDWDRLPLSVYGIGKDYECRDVRKISSAEEAEKVEGCLLSVRPFASVVACERSVRSLNAWFGSVNKT